MTRSAWQGLPEQQREAIRRASAQQSLRGFSRRSQGKYDLAKDIWAARDQYRVENFLIGCAVVLVSPVVIGLLIALVQFINAVVGK